MQKLQTDQKNYSVDGCRDTGTLTDKSLDSSFESGDLLVFTGKIS